MQCYHQRFVLVLYGVPLIKAQTMNDSKDYKTSVQNFVRNQKSIVRLRTTKMVSLAAILLIVFLTPLGFGLLHENLPPALFITYLSYLFIVGILTLGIYVFIRRHHDRLVLEYKKVNFISSLTVVHLSIANVLITMSSSYFGMDLISIGFTVITFATSYLMTDKWRALYIMGYCILSSLGYLLLPGDTNFIQSNTIITFATFGILLFFIGHFIYKTWEGYITKNYQTQQVLQELALQHEQQLNTFRQVSETIASFEMGNLLESDKPPKVSQSDSICDRTQEILAEFRSTQKMFTEALRKYEDIFENVQEGIVILSKDHLVEAVNPAGLEILGISTAESPSELNQYFDRSMIVQYKRFCKDDKQMQMTLDGHLTDKNGKYKVIEISSSKIMREGSFAGTRNIVRDITERKEAEEEILRARNTEKQFLAKISHEIRTPLNAIIGMSHLLYDTDPNSEQREHIDIINHSSVFLLSLINNILDLAKIEAGKMELQPRPFDLTHTLKVIHQSFAFRARDKKVRFTIDLDPQLDGIWDADEMVINQILFNLLSNAEKFTEKGTIHLSAKKVEASSTIQISVRDSGIGISHDRLPHIFDRFSQVHSKNEWNVGGTGLGLTVCKELTEMLDGSITVDSILGQGTIFVINLPLKQVSTTPTLLSTADAVLEPHWLDMKSSVLIAEDNAFNIAFISKIMNKHDIHYTIAKNGAEAVEKASEMKFDLILMDLEMPIMLGYEAASLIRSGNGPNHDTPIVALTASDIKLVKSKVMESGMQEMLNKPFQEKELIGLIREMVKDSVMHHRNVV